MRTHGSLPHLCSALALACGLVACSARAADQVEMTNGDRYVGAVVSLNAQQLVLTNEMLGRITLPRSKVGSIRFNTGLAAVPGLPEASPRQATTNGFAVPSSLASSLSASSNLLAKVQKEFLSGADAQAQEKFNELVSGLMNGKVSVDDVRALAKSTAEQVRASRKELGDSGGWALDGYLAILDQFLAEDPGAKAAGTNAPAPKASK